MNNDVSDILESLKSGYGLPVLSAVALRLVEMAADESVSTKELSALIDKDPSLAVRLLKMAKSAFFRSTHPATTLEQAIVRVGLERLRMMALTLSLRETFPMGKSGPLDYEKFWRHSLYVAILARHLAGRVKTVDPDEAFLAGLTLEIGLLVFYDLLVKDRGEDPGIALDPLGTPLDREQARYGLHHRQIGEIALRYWRFPEHIVSCQRVHGLRAAAADTPAVAGICEMARILAGCLLDKSKDFHSLFVEADLILGMDAHAMNDILLNTFNQVEDIAENLRLEMDKDKDLLAVMEKANSALSRINERIMHYNRPETSPEPPSFQSIGQGGDTVNRTLEAVAHEIRNPLTAVGGFAKRLASSLDPASKSGKYAQVIVDEAQRLEAALSEMSQTLP